MPAPTATGSQEGRQEETTNYEIGKTVRAIVHDQPQVERITLAVMVDGIDEVGADGKHTWKARDQADLDQIEKLVKSAVGFDEKRGDRLDVVSMPFVTPWKRWTPRPSTRPGKVERRPDHVPADDRIRRRRVRDHHPDGALDLRGAEQAVHDHGFCRRASRRNRRATVQAFAGGGGKRARRWASGSGGGELVRRRRRTTKR